MVSGGNVQDKNEDDAIKKTLELMLSPPAVVEEKIPRTPSTFAKRKVDASCQCILM